MPPLALARSALMHEVSMEAWLKRYQKYDRFLHNYDNLLKGRHDPSPRRGG